MVYVQPFEPWGTLGMMGKGDSAVHSLLVACMVVECRIRCTRSDKDLEVYKESRWLVEVEV